jgi:hypothetical protein
MQRNDEARGNANVEYADGVIFIKQGVIAGHGDKCVER